MSWPQWPGAQAQQPPVVAAAPPLINPAPSVIPPVMPYASDQWTQMQQQNWQQWAQWQQQYQQWHQQYGAEYQKSINAMAAQQTAIPNAAAPPPLPVDPPLPKDEGPKPAPPLPVPVPPPQQPQYSTQPPIPNQFSAPPPSFTPNTNQQSWKANVAPDQKRPLIGKEDSLAKRQMTNRQGWQNVGGAQPPLPNNNEELSEAEKKFDKQFAEWEAQFNKWKEQNSGHPDKQQYKEYEKKWEQWRQQLLDRREAMRRKRLGLPPLKPGQNPNFGVPPPAQGTSSAQSTAPHPPPKDVASTAAHMFTKPPPDMNNEPLQFKDGDKEVEQDGGLGFLNATKSDGIPGLDLVKDGDIETIEDNEEPIPVQKGPDLEAISKGINNILGDQKLMSMLSMVSQNQTGNQSNNYPKAVGDAFSSHDQSNMSVDDVRNDHPEPIQNFDDQTRSSFTMQPNDQEYYKGPQFGMPTQPPNRYDSEPPFSRPPPNFPLSSGDDMKRPPPGRFGNEFDKAPLRNSLERAPQTGFGRVLLPDPDNKGGFGRDFNKGPGGRPDLQREVANRSFGRDMPGFEGGYDEGGRYNQRFGTGGRDDFNEPPPPNVREGNDTFNRTPLANFRGVREDFNEPPLPNFRGGKDDFNGPPPPNFRGRDDFNAPPPKFRRGGGDYNEPPPTNFRDDFNEPTPNNFRGGRENFSGLPQSNFRGGRGDLGGPPPNFRGGRNDFEEQPPPNFRGARNDFDEQPPPNFRGGRGDFDEQPPPNFRGGRDGFDEQPSPNFKGGRNDFDEQLPPNFKGGRNDFDEHLPPNFRGGRDDFNEQPPPNFRGGREDFSRPPQPNFRGNRDDFNDHGPQSFRGGRDNFDPSPAQGFRGGRDDFRAPPPPNFGGKKNDFSRGNDFGYDEERGPGGNRFNRMGRFGGDVGGGDGYRNVGDYPPPPEIEGDFGSRDGAEIDAPEAPHFDNRQLEDEQMEDMPPDEFNQGPDQEEEMWKPVSVIDYDHKRVKPPEVDVLVQPFRMYDYRHRPLNRIPYPERPNWLSDTVKMIPEFDPPIIRKPPPAERRMYDDRFEPAPFRRDDRYRPDDRYKYDRGGYDSRLSPKNDGGDWLGRRNRSRSPPRFDRHSSSGPDREPWDQGGRNGKNRRWEEEERLGRDRDFDRNRMDERRERRDDHRDRRDDNRDRRDDNRERRDDNRERRDDNRERRDDHRDRRDEDTWKRRDSGWEDKRKWKNENMDEENFDRREVYKTDNRNKERESIGKQGGPVFPFSKPIDENKPSNVTMIEDLLDSPGRSNRPQRIVIILRGPPGSGKTYLAKIIKDKEVENGGSAPRILSLDDYFMVEQEKEVMEDGKRIKLKDMVYEYEAAMEESYRNSLIRSFKKTITDGYFPFIIVDNVNDKVKYFGEMWSFAKQNGFQVYICQMDLDVQSCTKRNIHNRSEEEIRRCIEGWETTPSHHPILDATSLLQGEPISEVEMEEINSPTSADNDEEGLEDQLDSSKWDNFDCSINNLARLDGVSKPPRPSRTMEEFLQLDDEWETSRSSKPGQKRVRWADLEERKQQEKMRAIGFVVGRTDWDRMMDPSMGESALTQTKYIEKVPRRF